MNLALWRRMIGESQWLMTACAAVLFGYCWVRVWTVSLVDMSRFEMIVEQFREFERFSPVPIEQLVTFLGRIAMTYDEPICIFTMTVWAIARGSDCISGELSRGTLEMLIAQPVSRLRVLTTKAAVTIVGVAVLAMAAWAGTSVGISVMTVEKKVEPLSLRVPLPVVGEVLIPLTWGEPPPPIRVPIRDYVSPRQFAPAVLNLFAYGLFISDVTTLLSSWDRYRWRTIGLAVGFVITQMVLEVIGLATDSVRWLLNFSCFTPYDPVAFTMLADCSPEAGWAFLLYDTQGQFVSLGPLGHNAILLALGFISFVLAGVVFCRRDLPAPL